MTQYHYMDWNDEEITIQFDYTPEEPGNPPQYSLESVFLGYKKTDVEITGLFSDEDLNKMEKHITDYWVQDPNEYDPY